MGDVEYGGSMNHAFENFAGAIEHAVHVRVVGHLDPDILGRYGASIAVDDVEWYVGGPYIGLELPRDGGLTSFCLDADRVNLPGVIESDRSRLCCCHTSSTSLSSTSAILHPFGNLAYSRN